MKLNFSKYQGAGNDFIIIKNTPLEKIDNSQIKKICNRHFGIGADGLIVINEHSKADYEMIYFNSDGNIGSMCGNGARCGFRYAIDEKIIQSEKAEFLAFDGMHTARIQHDANVEVSMADVANWSFLGNTLVIDTGSPHFVKSVSNLFEIDIKKEGQSIRYSKQFITEGINVNFTEQVSDKIYMRTYERGVEDETLACGTGTVAVALFHRFTNGNPATGLFDIRIKAVGGNLKVAGEFKEGVFKNIFLTGPVEKVFEGCIEIE